MTRRRSSSTGTRGWTLSIAGLWLLTAVAPGFAQSLEVMGGPDLEDAGLPAEHELPRFSGPHVNHPDHLHHIAFADAVDHAELIFDGVVTDIVVRRPIGAGILVTDYTFTVREWLDGSSRPHTITLTSAGGHLPEGTGMTMCGALKLALDRRYLIVSRPSALTHNLPIARAVQMNDDGSLTVDEAGRVVTGVDDEDLQVRSEAEYEDLDYLTRNPGESDLRTVEVPPDGADHAQSRDDASRRLTDPMSSEELMNWIAQRRSIDRALLGERLAVRAADPQMLDPGERFQWCGRINGPLNYFNWVPDDDHWTLRGSAAGNWNTLVDDNPSGASWLIGTFLSGGQPIRDRQPEAGDGDNHMGVITSQQLQDGGYNGTWASYGANGLNFTWYSGDACTRIIEVDTFVNPAIADDEAQHLKSLTHEFGHALGQSTTGAGGHEDRFFAIMFAGTFRQPPNYSSTWYGRMDDMAGVRDFLETSNDNFPGTFLLEQWVDMATWSQTHENSGTAGSLVMTDLNTYSGRRGDAFTIRGMHVENRGNLPASNVNLRFYLSANTTITSSDFLAGTAFWSTFSAQGRWSNGTRNLQVPNNIPAGTYFIGWNLTLNESERSTANNTAIMRRSNSFSFQERQFTVIGQPDLNIPNLSLSRTRVPQGESVQINSTINNAGDGASPATVVRFYRSSNSIISTFDTEIGQTSLSSLNAGSSALRSSSPIMNLPGNWYLGACVAQVQWEDNPGNLCSAGVAIEVDAVDELFEDRFQQP